MNHFFADTSFLCALFREQDSSRKADVFMDVHTGNVVISTLVLWEFMQSTRFQVFRNSNGSSKGFSKDEAERMMEAVNHTLSANALTVATVEWPDVHSIAEQLSAKHTVTGGHRPMDILHLATARHLKLARFLTFDSNQKKLAQAEGLKIPL